ncbi:hypothetical protein T484DRAFT_1903702 [Baffinella frigidus]|nr:hypothetical protein T484DRAFT_1903702 [Cryptophyta sp. CCMP2293]
MAERLVLPTSQRASQPPDPEMLAALIDFGFGEEESTAALVATGNRNVDVAIERIIAVRDNPSLAAAPEPAPQPAGVPCEIRVRLADGKNVSGSFTSVQDLAAVHAWVATQESAVTFTLVVPGPPSVRRDFGGAGEPLSLTLQEANLVPNGQLIVQDPARVVAAAAAASAAQDADRIKSSFNNQARDEAQLKMTEERAKKAREQKRLDKLAQDKAKLALAEDKITRKYQTVVRKVKTLEAEELAAAVADIEAFLKANPGGCDQLRTIREELLAASTGAAAAPAAAPAPAPAAGGAAAAGAAAAGPCQIRVRLDGGQQVVHSLPSTDTVQELHAWVEPQHGSADFSLLIPGPPSIRREFGGAGEPLSTTLVAAGLVPNGSVTVQALAKKDKVSTAPEGAEFVPRMQGVARGGMMGGRGMGPPGMAMGMGMGMQGMPGMPGMPGMGGRGGMGGKP